MAGGIPQHIVDAADEADENLINLQNGGAQVEEDDGGDGYDSGADFSEGADDTDDLSLDIDLPEFHDDGSGDEYANGDDQLPDGIDDQQGDGGVDWQQRALVAEGRLKTLGPQVSQLQQQVAELKNSGGGDVQSQIAAYMEQQAAKNEQARKREQIRAKMADEFGDDHLELMDEFISASVPQTSAAPATPSPQAAPVSVGMDYSQTVYAAHPNFDQINADPKFTQWLQGFGGDGVTHYERINAAHRAQQAGVVIGVVNQYLMSTHQQSGQRQQRQKAIQRQVAPSRSQGGVYQNKPRRQFLTPDQIASYYDRFNRGQFNGKSAQWAKIQKAIEASERHWLQG